LNLPETPPCSLALPDMPEFLQEYIGNAVNSRLESELTGALTAGLLCELDNQLPEGK
jgi:hypothetical protein